MIFYTIHFLILGGLAWLISRGPEHRYDQRILWGGLALRIASGLCFASIYTLWIKEGDTIYFFESASKLAELAIANTSEYLDFVFTTQYPNFKSEARDGFFVKVLSVFCVITGSSYWLSTLYFSIITFAPIWYLIKTIQSRFPSHQWGLYLAFLVLPSPIFWTSGILKDSLVVPSVFLIAALVFKVYYEQRWKWADWFGLFISLFLLWKLRYFIFGLTAAILIVTLTERFITRKIPKTHWQALVWLALLAIVTVGISSLNQNLYFSHFPQALYDNYIVISHASEPHESLHFALKPNWISFILHLPASFISGLFRPMIGEGSPALWIHGLENLTIALLTIFTLIQYRRIKLTFLVLATMLTIALLASTFPLASPNFGSLMRYKAIYLPFLFYLVSIIPINRWLQQDQ